VDALILNGIPVQIKQVCFPKSEHHDQSTVLTFVKIVHGQDADLELEKRKVCAVPHDLHPLLTFILEIL
jgi:hypothetical protein